LAKTILNTGTSQRDTTVNVEGTTGALTVNNQGHNLNVAVGLNDSVKSINGTVTATSTGGPVFLFVHDAAGPAAPNVTLGVDAHGFGFISGLAPATISYAANVIETANVFGPQTATTYTITDTAANVIDEPVDVGPLRKEPAQFRGVGQAQAVRAWQVPLLTSSGERPCSLAS
jgi:hypothetical protein